MRSRRGAPRPALAEAAAVPRRAAKAAASASPKRPSAPTGMPIRGCESAARGTRSRTDRRAGAVQSSDRSRWMRSDAILRGRFPLRRAPRPQWRGGRKNDTPSNGRMRSPRRSVRENTRRRSAVRRGHEVVPSRTPPSRRSHVLHATPRCRRRRPRRRRAAWHPDRALLEG